MRVESDTACRSGGWMHYPNGRPGGDWRDRLPAPPPRPVLRRPEPATQDAIARRLLALCPLNDAHRANLRDRGMRPERIAAGGFGSLPATGRRAIAGLLLAEFGAATMERFPGFYYRRDNQGRRYPMLAGCAGILIAILDAADRIVGFQIRADAPGSGPRYLWFSSNERDGGSGSGAPIHVAGALSGAASTAHVWITEGALKGTIAADLLGQWVIALPGVHGTGNLIAILRSLGVTRSTIAFDMDASANVHVLKARDALASLLLAAGIAIDLATWDPACKGIDDLLHAGGEPTIVPYPLQRRAGQLEPIPPAAVPHAPPRPVQTVAEARAARLETFKRLIVDRTSELVIDASATGTGKTYGFAQALREIDAAGAWPRVRRKSKGDRPARVLYVAPTTEAAREFVDMCGGLAMGVEGRNPDREHSDWWCVRPNLIARLGESRALPMIDACLSCKAEWQAAQGFWSCGYLEMKRRAEDEKVIAAPIASYFNGSTELRKFDVICVDESIIPALTELQTVVPQHVVDWTLRMNEIADEQRVILHGEPVDTGERYGERHPLRRFVNLLGMLTACRPEGEAWEPALPRLRECCPDLDGLIADLMALEPNRETRRYPFETPHPIGTEGDGLFPLRLIRDLIEALARELARPEQSDTRLWLTPEGLRLFLVQQHLVDILKMRTVINLDATPNPLLRFLFPNARTVRFDAPAPTRVTQITDLLATRRELANGRRRERLGAALETITAGARKPVIFTFKSLNPNVAGDGPRLQVSNPAAEYGHFDKETRALNRFGEADVLAIVGHYSQPLHVVRAEVEGLRFAAATHDAAERETLRLLPYGWRALDGSGLGRWTRADADPDVDAQIRWSEASTIIQAIGRGRATLRDERQPLEVYLLTNMPIAGVAINWLVSLDELGADPPRRTTPPDFYEQRDLRNAERQRATRERVNAALAALAAAGEPITAAAVARQAGVHRDTLYANATLRALVKQARSGSNQPVTLGVGSSSDTYLSSSLQDPTPHVTDDASSCGALTDSSAASPVRARTPQVTSAETERIDLSAVRPVLERADHEVARAAWHRTRDELLASLAAVAQAHGRDPVPRTGRSHDIAQEGAA